MIDLREINVITGVNEKGEPFITVSAVGDNDEMMLGQLDPTICRQQGFNFIGAAEAAEQDAAVFRVIQKLDLPVEMAAAIITELRNSRED